MSAIISSDEDTDSGCESRSSGIKQTDAGQVAVAAGNHQARTRKRWSSHSKEKGRLRSSVLADGVHEGVKDNHISPGQLYSTESGRLFHAGKILIVLVGLPATSKTLVSVAITRYTRWLGVRTQSFHVSEYRRARVPQGMVKLPLDYFSARPVTPEGIRLRRTLIAEIQADMKKFFEQGQLAVYDGMNIMREERRMLAEEFAALNVKVFFVESVVSESILRARTVEMAAASADYKGWNRQDALEDYKQRIELNRPLYEEMSPSEGLSYVKYFNFGEKLVVNNNYHGFLINKTVFFLMNLRDKKGCVYFARCGTSDKDKYIDDEVLNDEGIEYSKVLTDTVLERINNRRREQNDTPGQYESLPLTSSCKSYSSDLESPLISTSATLKRTESLGKAALRQHASGDGTDEDSFVVWTAPRKRTHDTAMYFVDKKITVRQRSQLQQLHPGVVADLSEEEIVSQFATEHKEYMKDPYHYRFPRAESYHDLAVRIEPLLLEMERMYGDILIIGHESTLKILYGYVTACSCHDIPSLSFTRDELIEVSFGPFENKIAKIPLVVDKKRVSKQVPG
ncbi:ACL185Cp [Eremothecium gossypii ATCC 10895]|uniref:ACL185Cp n=1 Tax=Eremothecium gossypii (strain ATCC 10895 / CBS 109.51 / FGSC 9923 / NRRL Y-1056) TaxID=284811 RepID=Q75CV1_EREGS|nr:ACL185Cp [Eremothecium gossypii ATCC 10895]AAS51043.1 ACL185Cp [Eremothecium gossypii ATCC 10895]AEY95333.1 FACL185Cp [Eremothecium gossypii FDAG1]